jgi:acid phosphatase (class A)
MRVRSGSAWIRISFALALFGWLAAPAVAQQLEASAQPNAEARPAPYLAGHEVDLRLVLGAFPAQGSAVDRQDVEAVRGLQHADPSRWQSANADAAFVYPRFDAAFGRPVDRATSPAMIMLLNRAIRDVSAAVFDAKKHFSRPRPYQRYQLRRVCGESKPPKPETHPSNGSSYPSGHSAYGWTTALVLARLAPDRAEALFQRADEYAQSRLVCGVHFPTDIAAGRLAATAVISRLDADPAFQADLALARSQLAVIPTERDPR